MAKNFLGGAGSLLSSSGLTTVTQFLGGAVRSGAGSGGIANIFGALAPQMAMNAARQATDAATQQAERENSQKLAAYYHAQSLREQATNQASFARQFNPASFY